MSSNTAFLPPYPSASISTTSPSTMSQEIPVPTSQPKPAPAWGGGSPWGKVKTPMPCSLEDVMSEELAEQLQKEEHDDHMDGIMKTEDDLVDVDALLAAETKETKDDFLLAQILQHEFDREHDAFLDKEEQKWNGTSKVKISFKNYRSVHPITHQEEEEEEPEEVWEEDLKADPVPQFNKSGISGKGKNIVTKHDSNLSGQRNAQRVMEQFPPDFETGDGHHFKMRLPNNVYNKLKRHSVEETKRSHKIHEKKEHSTTELAVDARTRLILYKLVNGGVLESVEGVVSTGKESVVFHGTGGSMIDSLVPRECAIKVFKTTLSEFKNRYEYIRGDVRFMKDEYKKQNPRKIIKIWAEKELANLKKMENSGIPCPRAVVLKKHVLVMEFLGRHQKPAPKLRDAQLAPGDLELAYDQCVQNMKKMYRDSSLVHADLSEFNMLWHNDTLYFIDVAQAVDIMHPRAMEFLLRDCVNVVKFFESAGVHEVKSEFELFNDITGLELRGHGKDFLAQIEQYEKSEEKLRVGEGKEYSFDYFFEKAQQEREDKRKRLEELFDESDSEEEHEDQVKQEQAKLDPKVQEKLHLVLQLDRMDGENDRIEEEGWELVEKGADLPKQEVDSH